MMNSEYISDALNELDDDLVIRTDEVRRGKRVFWRTPMRGMLAAAACAAVVIAGAFFIRPAVMHDSAAQENGVQFSDTNTGAVDAPLEDMAVASEVWKEVSVNSILLSVPPGWGVVQNDAASSMTLEHDGKVLTVGHHPEFVVCGTDLEEKCITIAGAEVTAGFYDGSDMWSYIHLGDDFVIINQAGDTWTREELDDIEAILDTVVCHPHTEKHDSEVTENHTKTEGHHGSGKHH